MCFKFDHITHLPDDFSFSVLCVLENSLSLTSGRNCKTKISKTDVFKMDWFYLQSATYVPCFEKKTLRKNSHWGNWRILHILLGKRINAR